MLRIERPEPLTLGINHSDRMMRWLNNRRHRLNFQTMSSVSGTKSPEKTSQNSRTADCGYRDKTEPGSCTPDNISRFSCLPHASVPWLPSTVALAPLASTNTACHQRACAELHRSAPER
ncbi:hypothetical protein ISCGN_017224 [Ixodes scapularis]